MKKILLKQFPAILLALVMVFSLFPTGVFALEASTKLVAWEYNNTQTARNSFSATTGEGTLSLSTGTAFAANTTGYFNDKNWSTGKYWLMDNLNLGGKSNLVISLRAQGSATGPRNWAVEYSVDGYTWKEAGSYSIPDAKATVTPSVKVPEDANTEHLKLRLRPKNTEAIDNAKYTKFSGTGTSKISFIAISAMEAGYQTLAAFQFSEDNCPEELPTSATDGWGYLRTTAPGEIALVSASDKNLTALNVKKWSNGHNWCMVFNTTDTTDMTLEADVLSSGTGPADWAVEYSVDLGANWVWLQNYHITAGTTKLQHQTIHLPDEAQNENLLVRFKVDGSTAVNGGNINADTCTSRINHITLTGKVGENHAANPESPTWPSGYGETTEDPIPADTFVGWNFDKATALPAAATKGWGSLGNSITTGPSYSGGALSVKGWSEGSYWVFAANTTGYTGKVLNMKLGSNNTGPRDAALEYSTDNGASWVKVQDIELTNALINYTFDIPDDAQAANCLFRVVITSNQAVKASDSSAYSIATGGYSRINLIYMSGTLTGTHSADPVSATFPADYAPKQEEAIEGEFVNAEVKGDLITGWSFEDASVMPADANAKDAKDLWGTMSHVSTAYISYHSKALSQTGWTMGGYWQFIANTSGCTDMTFQMKTGSSSTGPKNLSLRYSVDLGETWVEFATLSISGTVKKYIIDLPDEAQSTNLIIRVAVADDESIKGDLIKNGGSNKINNIAIYGVIGAGREANPAEVVYPADWSVTALYDSSVVFVPESEDAAAVTDFTKNENDRRVIASWGGNANYADALFVYGDLINSNDRLDGAAVMTVNVGGVDQRPGLSSSSTNSTNYYLGSKAPCMGTGTVPVDADGDGNPDMTTDEDGKQVPVTEPTDDYLQMKVSTAKYTDLGLSFRLRVSEAGPSGFTAKYSTDGETFTNFGTGSYSYAYTGYGYGGATFDVSGEGEITDGYIPMEIGGNYISIVLDVPQGCENAKDLYIRLYADRTRQTPKTNEEGEVVSTEISSQSSVRIDTVELTGCPMIHSDICEWVRTGLPTAIPIGTPLALTCPTEGAVISYSLDYGQTVLTYDPADPPILTEFPVTVKTWATCKASAYDSVKTTYYFRQAQVGAVKAAPNGGAVIADTELKLTCPTEGATILYSTDFGATWQTYDAENKPILTAELLEKECTILAKGTADGYLDSPISVLTYTLRLNEFYNLYFGQLHSHTNFSDGAGSCEDAFFHAAYEVDNLDFLAVTDHSNAFDNDLEASVHDGSMSKKWVTGHELAEEYTTEDFVGLYGYEMTWSNGLGHINTYNTSGFQSRTQSDFSSYTSALQNYYEALKSDSNSLSQFNHPGTTFGDFQDYGYYDEAIDELITIIEVGNGEGTIGSAGYFPSYQEYTRALDLGWHVAPTNNQDNHKGNWGDSNTARSVVMADSLTRGNIYDAIRNRRVYATEDNDFSIYYTLDDYEMGTILTEEDVGQTVHLKAVISDPTDSGSVKVDVIVNGGIVAASKSVYVKDSTVEFDLAPNYSYYYLRFTQADGNIAVTAPVWIGEVEAIGVKEVKSDTDIPVQGEEFNVTMEFYNDEDSPLEVSSIVFSANGTPVHTVVLDYSGLETIAAGSVAQYSFPFTYYGIGTMTMEVLVKGTFNGVAKQYSGTLEMDFLPAAMISDIVIDGTNDNDYVNGKYPDSMKNLIKLGAENLTRVHIETEKITPELLESCNLLIITPPARMTEGGSTISHFSDEFIQTVVDYVSAGGSVLLCGNADYNDTTYCQTHKEMNKLLTALGATVSFNSDEVAEWNENGTLNYRPVLFGYDVESEWLKGAYPELGFELYSACSVNMGANAETDKVYAAQPIILGNAETFSQDSKDDDGIYIDNKTEFHYVREKGQVTETVVQNTKAGGRIFLSGGVFMSDYNMGTDSRSDTVNGILMRNIIEAVGTNLPVTQIADARKGKTGDIFCVEGWVTNGTDNDRTTFFDTIYLQDETGGITVYPYSVEGLKKGTKLQITGFLDAYQGDMELQVLSCKVLDDKNLNVIAPKKVNCEEAMDYETYGGQLLKTQGEIVGITARGTEVAELRLRDETGKEATVFIDGYIYSGKTGVNTLGTFCKEGVSVTAVGMCFMHPGADSETPACCLRVRDCDEILPLSDVVIESAALSIDNDVDISYAVAVPEAAESVYMVFTMNGQSVTVPDDGSHTFLFEGVNPQCMGDNVSAVLHATVDGVEYTDEQATYSVLQYCKNKLADETISAELRTLLSDMLVYGTAAQNYVNYKTDTPVSDDSGIINPTPSTFAPISGYAPSFAGTAVPEARWISAGLILTNNVAMSFTFHAESTEGLSIKVTLNGREQVFTEFTPVEGKENTYRVTFNGILANEFGDDVTAAFYSGENQVGDSLTYSVNAYVCAKQNDANPALAALVQALYNYGASAKVYAG